MTELGVTLDPDFIRSESLVLECLMEKLSIEHDKLYGHALNTMNDRMVISWLFGELGLKPIERKQRTPLQIRMKVPHGDPSLKLFHLQLLVVSYAANARAVGSLSLIRAYRKASWLKNNLSSFEQYRDYRDNRIHTSLRDTLSTGRIASSNPNLQGIPKPQKIMLQVPDACNIDVTIRPRNVLVASDGYELVTFDISQADIRVMAHAVMSITQSGASYLAHLREERYNVFKHIIDPYLDQLKVHRNPLYHPKLHCGTCEPDFNPKELDALARILRGKSDLYSAVASSVTGSPVRKDDPARNIYKTVVLSMANSITPTGLAPRLGYGTGSEGNGGS